ncbi:hypothetical protein EXIGLDRAFT_629468 [Exidia glandulosa HHB12029]|uniref:Uncharacterized protein n=1 Tax=Exidia glandulosa HHB12029 TaxID=1314781 RepID=A0A165BLK5_EXIGL|nr:hypothetical protein EXIGLDRAFT_629468 [Exidia glandulosa HHB12029]
MTPCVVAIAYLMHKSPYVFPIVVGRRVERLMDNVKALEIRMRRKDGVPRECGALRAPVLPCVHRMLMPS